MYDTSKSCTHLANAKDAKTELLINFFELVQVLCQNLGRNEICQTDLLKTI